MNGQNFRLSEMDNMLPYEREIYVALLINSIEERKKDKKG